jgi:hypothetical protein
LKLNRKRGLALPMAIVFLTIFAVFVVFLISYFAGVGRSEFLHGKLNDKQYAHCMAAMNRIIYRLRFETPHTWSGISGGPITMTMSDGTTVECTWEDISV